MEYPAYQLLLMTDLLFFFPGRLVTRFKHIMCREVGIWSANPDSYTNYP